MRNFVTVVFLLISMAALAQEFSETHTYPRDGVERLALYYLRTDFTPEQRERLNYAQLDLIFLVDSTGFATLEEVNGIDDMAIIDSLRNRRDTPPFVPATISGRPKEDLFILQLQFPPYESVHVGRWGHFGLDELEYVNRTGQNFQLLIGGVVNSFSGNPSRYLSTGGGLKMDMLWQGKSKYGFGMTLCVYGNHAREHYPVNTTREFDSTPTTFILGVFVAKELYVQERRAMSMQFELDYAGQNVSSSENPDDNDNIQFDGFSPGLLLNYSIQIGKESFRSLAYYAGVSSHHLNFHAAARPLFLNFKEARGVMFELGVSYKVRTDLVSEYRFRP